jgi:hypothetical protein
MKHSRTSRKQVEELCKLFNCRLVCYQRLGNRKDYWYEYSVINNETGEFIAKYTTLKEANNKLIDKCREYLKEREV